MPRKTRSAEELKKTIDTIKIKIEKNEKRITRPFIPLILKAEEMGNLEQLLEACKQVVRSNKQAKKSKKLPTRIATNVIIPDANTEHFETVDAQVGRFLLYGLAVVKRRMAYVLLIYIFYAHRMPRMNQDVNDKYIVDRWAIFISN